MISMPIAAVTRSFGDYLWCAADSYFVKASFTFILGSVTIGLVVRAIVSPKPEDPGLGSGKYAKYLLSVGHFGQARVLAWVVLALGFLFVLAHSFIFSFGDGKPCGTDLSSWQEWVVIGLLVDYAATLACIGRLAFLLRD